MSFIGQSFAYARFAWQLRGFLRERATPERGTEIILERLRNRRSHFLSLMRRAVYENPQSPYHPLLRSAGCEYKDLERMVQTDGIEATLQRLYASGVYVTIDEFKGRQDVVRGATTFRCQPDDFNNPLLLPGLGIGSSGSRGPRTRTTANLERSAYHAYCQAVMLRSHGLRDKPTVLWMPILPSAAGMAMLLQSSKMGTPPSRWFSPVAARTVKPALAKRLATLYAVYAGRAFGCPMPAPEYVSGEQVALVLEHVLRVLEHGDGCVLFTSPNSAVRLCHLARETGHDLAGLSCRVGGEPLTPAKLAEIRSAGADAIVTFAFAEGGTVGLSCADRRAPDDMHLLSGSTAAIQHRRDTAFGSGSVDAFLFTSCFDRAPKILLNVESGDYGVIEDRDCTCEFGGLGLTRHIHTLRSFDKLTGEGMTFAGTDLVHLVEEVLPSRFGGSSIDYQMVEREDETGNTYLDVRVSPDIRAVDERELVQTVLSWLRKGGDTNRMMTEVWRERDMVRVVRARPHITAGGKLLPFEILRETRR